MIFPLMAILFMLGDVLCGDLNIINLVFSVFKESLFALNHWNIEAISLLVFSSNDVAVLSWKIRFVSSANSIAFELLVIDEISLIYNRKSNGPNMDPWGTPQVIGKLGEDSDL